MLNGKPAKLFRSGSLSVLELLMMNGYTTTDLLGRTGKNLTVTVDGQRMVFRGEPSTPCVLTLNDKPAKPSDLVFAGDTIHFIPAVCGANAKRTVAQVVGDEFTHGVMVNGALVSVDTPLNPGDEISLSIPSGILAQTVEKPEPAPVQVAEEPQPATVSSESASDVSAPRPTFSQPIELEPVVVTVSEPEPESELLPEPVRPTLAIPLHLNGQLLMLNPKEDNSPYYLMDLLDRSGIDFEHLDRPVELLVNGMEAPFSQILYPNDDIIIRYTQRG